MHPKVLGSVAGGLVVSRLTDLSSVHGYIIFPIFLLWRACRACHVSIATHVSTVRMSFDANSMQNGSPLPEAVPCLHEEFTFFNVLALRLLTHANSIHLQELRRA